MYWSTMKTRIYKNKILCCYSSKLALLWSWGATRGSSSTRKSCRESEQPAGADLSLNSRPYVVLKIPRDQFAMLIFHWSQLTPTRCLLFNGHGLPPRNAWSPLVMVYIHAMLVLLWHFHLSVKELAGEIN